MAVREHSVSRGKVPTFCQQNKAHRLEFDDHHIQSPHYCQKLPHSRVVWTDASIHINAFIKAISARIFRIHCSGCIDTNLDDIEPRFGPNVACFEVDRCQIASTALPLSKAALHPLFRGLVVASVALSPNVRNLLNFQICICALFGNCANTRIWGGQSIFDPRKASAVRISTRNYFWLIVGPPSTCKTPCGVVAVIRNRIGLST
jgi:hypothetical protein